MFYVKMSIQRSLDMDEGTTAAKKIFKTLQSDRYRVLIWLLRSYFVKREDDHKVATQKAIWMSKFAFVYSCSGPTLRAQECNGFIECFWRQWKSCSKSSCGGITKTLPKVLVWQSSCVGRKPKMRLSLFSSKISFHTVPFSVHHLPTIPARNGLTFDFPID